jgi:cell cycle sensor histidine kinase DivJ
LTDKPVSGAEATSRDALEAAVWHAGWFTAAVLASFLAPADYDARNLTWALGCAALPGAVGVGLAWAGGRHYRAVMLALWGAGIGAAVILAGGLGGPLGVWVLAPLAAAAILGGTHSLPSAVALSVIAAGAAALAQWTGLAPPPVIGGKPWLPLYVLATLGVALGAALVIIGRRDAARRRALEASAQRMAAVLTDYPYLVMSLADDGAVREIFGGGGGFEAARTARSFAALAEDGAALRGALARAEAEGPAAVAVAPAEAPDRWYAGVLARHGDGFLVVLRDATLERSREATLEQAAADAEALNAGKSRFLANMSHELRTPLNAIIGFSDIMRGQMFGPMTEKYAEYAGLIHESGGHLLDLINDVLDMSKIEAQRFELSREDFDAREAVSAALRLVRVQADVAKVQLRGLLPPRPLEVNADRRALKQIVLNLTANALKFTPRGGQVSVSIRAEGDQLELAVSDTGVGIAPADLERLGKPYEQAGGVDSKAMGTGLGLSLVRAFAELHGGAMSIESAVGEGTTVTVRLPVMSAAAQASAVVAGGDNVIAFNPQR